MSYPEPDITVNVDVTNPGQFFACCGVLELADRLWPGAEGWFEDGIFCIEAEGGSLVAIFDALRRSTVANTMTPAQLTRLDELSAMTKKQRSTIVRAEEEKKALESLRRELPIVLLGPMPLRIDWFCDDLAGGSRFKTWAGQQSVLGIASAMHGGLISKDGASPDVLHNPVRGTGLPFNFDSDLGGQGSAIDIGFSFDPLAGSRLTRIEGTCKPGLEFFCFIGLQRFRPREVARQNRFVFTAWRSPRPPCIAAAVACGTVRFTGDASYEFKLLYRTKYLKSFLPATAYQGDRDE